MKSASQKAKHAAYLAKWRHNNQNYLERSRKYQRERHKERAAAIRAAKDKPCHDCGNRYPSFVMDFDHRNPSDKRFNIGTARGNLTDILAEIAKCDVVCSNCHRIRTWTKGYYATMQTSAGTTTMSPFALDVMLHKYAHTRQDGTTETWSDIARRQAIVLKAVGAKKSLTEEIVHRIEQRKFIPGGRYLYATGRPFHQTQNCLLMRAGDSREGWAELMHNASMGLMTGAGIGVDYSDVRAKGKPIRKTGGFATGPVALMKMVNEAGRGIMQGGSRRSALWAGLSWKHADIFDFIEIKNWQKEVRDLKAKDFNFPAQMDGTNVSVQLDDEFFDAFNNDVHGQHCHAHAVYWATLERMLKTGEPGFSIDTGKNSRETLRNACTEISSADDSDICNLGSINMARIESLDDFKATLECATAFLLAGTVYSDVPYAKVDQIRTKNRRLGLGLMGIHEWLTIRGKRYGHDAELEQYYKHYAFSTAYARSYAKDWDLSAPVKTRAIAPTGTIGIVAETTTGIEPLFCTAYKRRYLKGSQWNYQYVVDPTAQRLIANGVSPDAIEDAYTLSGDMDAIERRLAFQSWTQRYVDHGISSTINLPAWGSEQNNADTVREFGARLIKYLPTLRGITCYPDGARGGQPLNAVNYRTAVKHVGEIFIESTDVCDLRGGGTCGA